MRYVNIDRSAELPDLSKLAPFLAIVVVENRVPQQRQAEISDWLVAMGCRYVLSCGHDCESWCDTVRQANLQACEIEHMSASDFVMTTSHPRERLRSVFWFAKRWAQHPEVALNESVVIHLAERDRGTEYQGIFQQS